ncbi:MAG TPA: MFS transporter, partial [Sphingopyxis sp.]|nr:MFS transporter [Sphingopyxis sp.]
SVAVNRLLKGQVSARYSPASVVVMGLFVVAFYWVCRNWGTEPAGALYDIRGFLAHDRVIPLLLSLLGIAISGGMFVVPLYAFLTTTVPKDQTARTVAANNIVNSGAMVAGSLLAMGLGFAGVGTVDQLLMSAAMCLVSAWLAVRLHRACD